MYHSEYKAETIVYGCPIRYVMPVEGVEIETGVDAQMKLPAAIAGMVDFNKVLDVPVTWICMERDYGVKCAE